MLPRKICSLLLCIHAGQFASGTRPSRRPKRGLTLPGQGTSNGKSTYRTRPGVVARIAVQEEGYINFVSCFLFMAFVLGLCLVGNVGRWTNERIEMQNAADSGAYSSAVQMARAMNAVTATNHMMGELTGLVVMLDSFVGRERLRDGMGLQEVTTSEIDASNDRLENLQENAPYPDLVPRAPEVVYSPVLNQLDEKYIELVYQLFVTSEFGKHRAHGTIYDAQLALKHNLALSLLFKNGFGIVNQVSHLAIIAGNVPFLVWLKALGWAGELSATAGHLWMDYEIFGMSQEWILLQTLQTAIQLPMVPAFVDFVEDALVPALSFHADSVTGSAIGGDAGAPGPMNQAVEQTLSTLKDDLEVTHLTTFPLPNDLVLPVRPEPANTASPSANAGNALWRAGQESVPDESTDGPMQQVTQVFDTVLGPFGDILDEVSFLTDTLKDILDLTDWLGPAKQLITRLLKSLGIGAVEEAEEILDSLENISNVADRLTTILQGVADLSAGPPKEGYDLNPSKEYLEQNAFDWQTERTSQWTRATYPHVDSFRRPIRAFLRDGAGVANASTYYAQWSNRDTLIASHQIRHAGGDSAPHMYVMQASTAAEKGNESWTDADPRQAEQMFTLTGYAVRQDAPPRLLGKIFPAPAGEGRLSQAQAMVYNANGRELNAGGGEELQPNTGWDTLNWAPPVTAPEWAHRQPIAAAAVPAACCLGRSSRSFPRMYLPDVPPSPLRASD